MVKKPASDKGLFLRRVPNGFAFASEYDRELAGRWGIGAVVRADIHRPRSGKHQRWFQALLRVVWKHQDFYASSEALHKDLKFKLGMFDSLTFKTGEVVVDFHSTSYDAMEEGAFNEHVNRVWDVISRDIIPGLDAAGRAELVREIDKLLWGSSS